MKVYNAYLKILKQKIRSIVIYFILFITLFIIMTKAFGESSEETFVQTKGSIVINNYDNSKLVDSFLQYLGNYCVIDYELEKESQQDALFFRQIDYIITIPKGFGEDFLAGKNPKMEKFSVPDSYDNFYIEQLVNNYLQSSDLILRNAKDITEDELIASVTDILSENTVVKMQSVEKKEDYTFGFYYRYLGYILTAMIIIIVGTIMMSFNQKEIYQRNVVGPISLSSLNLQLILGNLTFVGIALGIFFVLGIVLDPVKAITLTTLLFWCNTFVYAISILCLAYLLSFVLKSKAAIDAVSTIISLGVSFLSGVFMVQSMLDETVLRIASFFPTYWFVLANDTIATLNKINIENIKPVVQYMLVELAFAAAFFSVTLVVSKYKRRAEN